VRPVRARIQARYVWLAAASLFALALASPAPTRSEVDASHVSLRIGWQAPWATQGQIVQALKHTNALSLNGLSASYQAFSYGGPLNVAALAGQEDVIFTADQPAAALLATGAKWKIVARLMYNRVSLYVPPRSPIRKISDLRGKTVGMPFGAAAQREALRAIAAAGLDPDRDIHSVNLDIYAQVPIVEKSSGQSWGSLDALAGFDPVPAAFQARHLIRMLHASNVVAVVMMSEDFINRNRGAAERFLRAYDLAYYYYVRHQAQAGGWFVRDSGLPFGANVLRICASVEPNIRAKKPSQLRTMLSRRDLAKMQGGIAFLYAHGLIKKPIAFRQYVDQSYLRRALRFLGSHSSLFKHTVAH
jgi:sulfonate transport system substrate-binding protein